MASNQSINQEKVALHLCVWGGKTHGAHLPGSDDLALLETETDSPPKASVNFHGQILSATVRPWV